MKSLIHVSTPSDKAPKAAHLRCHGMKGFTPQHFSTLTLLLLCTDALRSTTQMVQNKDTRIIADPKAMVLCVNSGKRPRKRSHPLWMIQWKIKWNFQNLVKWNIHPQRVDIYSINAASIGNEHTQLVRYEKQQQHEMIILPPTSHYEHMVVLILNS